MGLKERDGIYKGYKGDTGVLDLFFLYYGYEYGRERDKEGDKERGRKQEEEIKTGR